MHGDSTAVPYRKCMGFPRGRGLLAPCMGTEGMHGNSEHAWGSRAAAPMHIPQKFMQNSPPRGVAGGIPVVYWREAKAEKKESIE